MKIRMHVFFVCTLALKVSSAHAGGPSPKLIAQLIRVESNGRDAAVGDLNLKNHAYGALQVRQPVCDDVNKRFGTTYRAEACRNNRGLSIEIFCRYMSMYATKAMLGHEPRDEDYARIWNGGPSGPLRESTEKYWKKVNNSHPVPHRLAQHKKK